MNKKLLFILLVVLLPHEASIATPIQYSEATECDGRPEFITEVRPDLIGGFEKLPPIVLVARDAEYYAESKENGEDLKIHSFQSFRRADDGDSRIVCGSAQKISKPTRFSLFAPTVIDTTPTKKAGHSLWQFQMLASPVGFNIWNERSLSFVKGQSLEKSLTGFGSNYRLYQINSRQYEMVVSKTTATSQEYLSIKFDAVTSF